MLTTNLLGSVAIVLALFSWVFYDQHRQLSATARQKYAGMADKPKEQTEEFIQSCWTDFCPEYPRTPAGFKSCYYKKAKELHPDRHPGDLKKQEDFTRLGKCYETITGK